MAAASLRAELQEQFHVREEKQIDMFNLYVKYCSKPAVHATIQTHRVRDGELSMVFNSALEAYCFLYNTSKHFRAFEFKSCEDLRTLSVTVCQPTTYLLDFVIHTLGQFVRFGVMPAMPFLLPTAIADCRISNTQPGLQLEFEAVPEELVSDLTRALTAEGFICEWSRPVLLVALP